MVDSSQNYAHHNSASYSYTLTNGSLDSNTRQNGEILINVCKQALAFGTTMISADTPILFAKACEIFILELTLRAWMNTEDNNRQALQRCDIFEAIMGEDLLSFLAKIVSFDRDQKETSANSHGDTHQCPANPMNTNERPAYPMTLQNLNSALLMRSQEAPQHLAFPPSFLAAKTSYRLGFNEQTVADCPGGTHQYPEYPMNLHNLNSALCTRSYEATQHHVFPPSFSSTENNYWQGFNEQTVADCRGDTLEYPASPMNFHNLNSALLMTSQEGPQHLVFPPQFSSAETNYLPDLNQ